MSKSTRRGVRAPKAPKGRRTATASALDNETSRQRFERIAARRMTQALRVIDRIGNTSRTASYKYTAADVAAMSETLHEAVNRSMSRFRPAELRASGEFSFSGTGSRPVTLQ